MTDKNRWLFPTNTNNMRLIIAQGLLTSPDGFPKKKYYADALEVFPGLIPIYKNTIPADILKKCVSERDSLTPCIIEFKLNAIKGIIKTVKNNNIIDVDIESIDKELIDMLLILAPLPFSCFSKLLFKSNEDQKQFEEDSKNRSNVILSGLKLQSTKNDQKLFSFIGNNSFVISPTAFNLFVNSPVESNKQEESNTSNLNSSKIESLPPDDISIDYDRVYSLGGLMAIMFYFSKNGRLSNKYFMSMKDLNDLPESTDKDILLIYQYLRSPEKDIDRLSPKEQIYYGLIDMAIKNDNFKEDIINFLESDMWDERSKPRAQNLATKLKQFETSVNRTVSEQFKEAKTSLEKVLLMLFLREDCEALIDYNYLPQILNDLTINEELIIQFAMIFGIRDKYIKIPKFIREFECLQNFISYKMAIYAHSQTNSKIEFNSPQKPSTLVDMLKNNAFCQWVAKILNIEDHLLTTIIIPANNEAKLIKNKIIFEGIVPKQKVELIEEKYFDFMINYKFVGYNEFCKKYKNFK
ncbi:MAG: hypothetical protein HQK65_05795 [Desulfamplus sp.]|nr:hypothetical protein [Desulfamplus sp.]